MTRRFLGIGECMVELSPRPGGLFAMGYAGDTFNTAWYARQIAPAEIDVAYLSAVGDDAVSDAMRGFMERAGVRPVLAVRPGRSVGLYMITVTAEGERSFSYWRDSAAARTLADDLDVLPDLGAGDVALFSGITLAILPETGREALLEACHRARRAGVTMAFDPNIRPRLWPDADSLRHWITEGAATADIVLPSFDDEATHFGDTAPDGTAERYRNAGAGMVVVKNGVAPLVIFDGSERHAVQPDPSRNVVDTTAAGDSFNAAFLIGRMCGLSVPAAAAEACALSRRVIEAPGALVAGVARPLVANAG